MEAPSGVLGPPGATATVAEMSTRARASTRAPTPPSASLEHSRWSWRQHATSLLVVGLAGGVVAGFFMAMYLFKEMPIGWDAARYLDQANLVSLHGLSATADLTIPRPSTLLASRVGFPVSVLSLS